MRCNDSLKPDASETHAVICCFFFIITIKLLHTYSKYKQIKYTIIETQKRTGTTWMVQVGRTVPWVKHKCGAIACDYVQQTYEIKSSISDLRRDSPFYKTLVWSQRSSNSHRKSPDSCWAWVILDLWLWKVPKLVLHNDSLPLFPGSRCWTCCIVLYHVILYVLKWQSWNI